MYSDYIQWLQETKHFGERAAHDCASRLKRALRLLKSEEFTSNSIDQLGTIEEFNQISTVVRSQIKRAVRLYLEFLNQ